MTLLDRPHHLMRAAAAALLALLAVPATARAAGPAESPPAPYYSVHLATEGSKAKALATLKALGAEPAARAEKRASGYHIRFGAWAERAEAESAHERHRAKFADARVIQIENPVDWLMADGSIVTAPGSKNAGPADTTPTDTTPAAEAVARPAPQAPATPAAPVAVDEDAFRAAARRLDGEVRRWLEDGVARADGYTYAMDVAPLLLYAALRRDAALYARLHEAALPLVVNGDDATAGFVLWRTKSGAEPEVSGSAEALWLARALWAGHRLLRRPDDRGLALRVVDGYSRHARGEQSAWHVAKYYAFGTESLASLSLLPSYHPDFLEEAEPFAGGAARGMARRSYALLQRAVTPSRLLVPLIQPSLNDVLPGIGVNLYAPNGLVALEDSCAAAEGAARGVPQLAKNVLAFAADGSRRDANGRLYAYFHRRDGRPLGEQVLSSTGYACLARIAAAQKDTKSLPALKAALLGDMQVLADTPQQSNAPLYGAGPMLLAAEALGAL
jgi:hypothetical protein